MRSRGGGVRRGLAVGVGLVYLTPLAAVVGCSLAPVGQVLWARWKMTPQHSVLSSQVEELVHVHFLSYGILVPGEDIWAVDEGLAYQRELAETLRQSCGKGDFLVWLPFAIRLPVVGEIRWSRCWGPPLMLQRGV